LSGSDLNGDGRAPAEGAVEPAPPNFVPRGVWSRQTIRERHARGPLISGTDGADLFCEARLDFAGLRLRMGPEVYVSPTKADCRQSIRRLDPEEAFLIPSGQFAFLLTEEIVTVPPDALAFITLRSRAVKFKGLVNVSGFHADPGYHGRLVFAVYNAGPGDVHLRRGDELFVIMLADLDQRTDRPREPNNGFMNIPVDLITPIRGQFQSFAGLKENIDDVEGELKDRLNAMEREVAVLRWAVVLFLGALIALGVRMYVGH
jgi:dCTP deaminase